MEGYMQTQDDDFPYTSDDPSLVPLVDQDAVLPLTSQGLDDLKSTLRLVVGSALTGRDVFVSRLRRMQAEQEAIAPEAVVVDENETSRDQLRYLLLGMLFETPDILQRGLVTAEQASLKVINLINKILSPLTNSWVFSPVKGQYDGATARGEAIVDRLIMKGRLEEHNSRQILQQKAIDDLIHEFLEYVVLKTEIRQIIQEESISVAGDVAGEFQEQSATVDSLLEQKLRSVFRKRVSSQSTLPPENPADGE
jgi:hypothetical protein